MRLRVCIPIFLVAYLIFSCTDKEVQQRNPLPPLFLEIKKLEPSQLTLVWQENERISKSYHLSYKKSNEAGFGVETVITPENFQYTLDGLRPNTTYHFRVRSKAQGRYSEYAQVVAKTPTFPDPPHKITVFDRHLTTLFLQWEPATSQENKVIAYYFSYKQKNASTYNPEVKLSASQPFYKLSQLKPATQYEIRVRTQNDQGFYSLYSEVETITITPPSAPSVLSIEEKKPDKLTLIWDPIADKDGNPILHYYLTHKEKDSTRYGEEVAVTQKLKYAFANLKPDTQYDIRIRAKDQNGIYSPYYTISVATLTFPNPPSRFEYRSDRDGGLTLQWNEAIDRDGSIADYLISYKKKGGAYINELATPQLSHNFSDLDLLTPYEIRIRTRDNDKLLSPYRYLLTRVPVPPTTLSVQRNSSDLVLDWSSVYSGSISGYHISYKEKAQSTYSPEVALKNTKSTHTLKGLKFNTQYDLRIRSRDSSGLYSRFKQIRVTTLAAPIFPSGIKLIDSTSTTLTLAWEPATDADGSVVSYHISYCEKDTSLCSKEITTTKRSHTFTQLKGSTQYEIRLRAKDNDGNYGQTSALLSTKLITWGVSPKKQYGQGDIHLAASFPQSDGSYIRVTKIDEDGSNTLWYRTYESERDSNGGSTHAALDGGYIVAGTTSGGLRLLNIDVEGYLL